MIIRPLIKPKLVCSDRHVIISPLTFKYSAWLIGFSMNKLSRTNQYNQRHSSLNKMRIKWFKDSSTLNLPILIDDGAWDVRLLNNLAQLI